MRKFVVLLLIATAFAQTPRIQTVKFFSQALQQEMPYVVFLPASYDKTNIRYPVLYLLNGLTGHASSWDLRSGIQKHMEPYDIIIVAVEGGNSWYVNSASNPKDKYEEYFLSDVIKDVRTKFQINDGEYARAVAGLSAGGYAAINLALRNPRVFAFAGSLSGAVSVTRDPDLETELKDFKISDIFGPPGSKTRNENDLFLQAEKADPSITTYIWMACGTGTTPSFPTICLRSCCVSGISRMRSMSGPASMNGRSGRRLCRTCCGQWIEDSDRSSGIEKPTCDRVGFC